MGERVMQSLTEDQRVAMDKHGAEVVEINPGLYEVWCASHATQLISRNREYLRRRAEGHNVNWHPNLGSSPIDDGVEHA